MLQNIVVKNFRCFAGLLVHPLKRVNLITGKNNTGKTALLEAIHLTQRPTDCSNLVNVNQFRGIETPGSAIQEICSWLFFNGDARNGVELTTQDAAGVTRTLKFYLVDAATSMREHKDAEDALGMRFTPEISSSNAPRLILRYEQPGQEPKVSIGVGRDSGLAWLCPDTTAQRPSAFLPSMNPNAEQDVNFFGELELNKRQDEIIEPLTKLEPRLQSLRLIPIAGRSVIHGDVGLNRMVPLPMLGEGMRRLLSIVLAIANVSGGVVLIDEIENGFHYSVLEMVWQAIATAAERSDTQVFATTHSWECLKAAGAAFAGSRAAELAVHRLERRDGELTAVTYDHTMIETSLGMGLEVR